MGTIIVEGNITCDHLLNYHPAKRFDVEMEIEFEGVDSHKELVVGDRGSCEADGCDHACGEIEVTTNRTLFFNINPIKPQKGDEECTSPKVLPD